MQTGEPIDGEESIHGWRPMMAANDAIQVQSAANEDLLKKEPKSYSTLVSPDENVVQ